MEKTVVLSTFPGVSDMERIGNAMAWLAENPGSELIIEPGVYTITTPLAVETMEKVMDGSYGGNPQRIMFNPRFTYSRGMSLAGQRNTRISAYGALFLVDGFMEPVSVIDCENVELCGLTIDHKRKPYSHGTVTAVEPVEWEGKRCFRAEVTFGKEFALQENTPCFLRQRFYDPVTDKRTYIDIFRWIRRDSQHVEMILDGACDVHVGLEYYTIHTYHSRPAILIERAKNVTLTDVTIHSQPGMGIVGNRSEDILLRRLSIIPSIGEHWSTNTDATHFTSIKGLLRYENCFSEAHGDDFINIHGYYQNIISRLDSCTCIMQEKTPDGTHAQTLDYPDVGDTLELVERSTLLTKDTYTVVACVPMHEEWCCQVQLDHPLPEATDGLMLADTTRLPRVEVVGCSIQSHCARSILIKSRNVLLERNFLKNAEGPAIEIAAEAHWSEGVCPHNVTVRGNRIVDCGMDAETGGILVISDSKEARGQSMYNITIEDNVIDVGNVEQGVFARNVDGLKIHRNQIICKGTPVKVQDCTNVAVDIALA